MFVYVNRVTGEVVETTPELDEALAVIYDAVQINETTAPDNEPGYIYFDGDLGEIRCVSLASDAEATARYDVIRVDREQALRFMTGEDDPAHWSVGYTVEDRSTPRLMPGTAKRVVVVRTIDDDWFELAPAQQNGLVRLTVTVARKEGLAIFDLAVPKSIEIDHAGVEAMTFMFTRAHDRTVFFGSIDVDLAELCEKGRVTAPLSSHIGNENVSVFTRRVFPHSGAVVEDYYQNKRVLPIGHFIDLMRFGRVRTADTSLEARIDRGTHRIVFRIPEGKYQLYDRPLDRLPIMLTKRFDPGFVLHTSYLMIQDLVGGKDVEIAIPAALSEVPFDIVTPLVFVDPIVVE